MNGINRLAAKFAEKLASHFAEEFPSRFRALLNEMEGDYMTLRVIGFHRASLVSFGELYQSLLSIRKQFDRSNPMLSMSRLVNYGESNNVKHLLNKLIPEITKHLKASAIDFSPHQNFSQPRIESFGKLFDLVRDSKEFLVSHSENDGFYKLKSENDEYNPNGAGENDSTSLRREQ
jgi:hypothetical protein